MNLAEVRARAETITRDIVEPAADAVDAGWEYPEKGVRTLVSELGGLVVPEEFGGLGHGLSSLLEVCEIVGRSCASTAICFGMHTVGSAVIAARATSEQAELYLQPICSGAHLTTLALSEPGTGANFWLPQVELTTEGDGFRVNGNKTFVTNGGYADSYVISTVAANEGAPPGEFSCVLVPATAEGLTWGGDWTGIGMRGNSSRSLELANVPLTAVALLGEPGDQIWYVFNVVAPYFLMAMTGTYLGVASAALDEVTEHLVARRYRHTGQTLSSNQVLQHRLGEIWSQVQRTRHLARWAAAEAENEGPEALPALCASKAEVADCVVEVVNEAMTLSGGLGFRSGARMERHLRDARAAHVMSPTTDLLKTWVGRALLGENVLG